MGLHQFVLAFYEERRNMLIEQGQGLGEAVRYPIILSDTNYFADLD